MLNCPSTPRLFLLVGKEATMLLRRWAVIGCMQPAPADSHYLTCTQLISKEMPWHFLSTDLEYIWRIMCTVYAIYVVVWYRSIYLYDYPMFFRIILLALGQSYHCPSTGEVTLKNIDKWITRIPKKQNSSEQNCVHIWWKYQKYIHAQLPMFSARKWLSCNKDELWSLRALIGCVQPAQQTSIVKHVLSYFHRRLVLALGLLLVLIRTFQSPILCLVSSFVLSTQRGILLHQDIFLLKNYMCNIFCIL